MKTYYKSTIILSTILFIFSCKKPLAPEIENEILEEEIVLVSEVIVGDTIGDVGFIYNNDINFTSCDYGNPNDGGHGIDFDNDSIIDLCFYGYVEDYSGNLENHVYSGSGVNNQNENLHFLSDSLNISIINNGYTTSCNDNFIFDDFYGFCGSHSWNSMDDPEGGYTISGPWCEDVPHYLVFKIETKQSTGIGWIYLNPSDGWHGVISYGYQPNIDCN